MIQIGLVVLFSLTIFSQYNNNCEGFKKIPSLKKQTHDYINNYNNNHYRNEKKNNNFILANSNNDNNNNNNNNNLPITKPPHTLSIHQSIYLVLTSIFVTCLIIAGLLLLLLLLFCYFVVIIC